MDYWIIIDGKRRGPYVANQLPSVGANGSTPIWREGLLSWVPASTVPELTDIFNHVDSEIVSVDELGAEEFVEMSEEIGAVPSPVAQQPPQWQPTPPPTPVFEQVPQHQYRPYIDPRMEEEKPPKPGAYLAWSIVVTLLCCIPFGIVAIVYSTKVNSRYAAGDYAGAEKASERTQLWIIAAIVGGILLGIFQSFIEIFLQLLNA